MKLLPESKISLSLRSIFLIFFLVFSILVFDVLVSSSSAVQFRIIYDIAFGLIMFVLGYTSMLLLSNKSLSWKGYDFVFPKSFYAVPLVLNLFTIFSILWLGVPGIGFLNENILLQGLSGLLPFANFLIVMTANAVVVYVNIHEHTDVHLYKLAAYILGVIAIEICLAMYTFHIAGFDGIRWILILIHIMFIGLAIRAFQRFKTTKIHIKIAASDLLLILLAVGIFAMVYIPFGLYNLYNDNAVVVDSTMSIVFRGSLQPYYTIDSYYSPIMGFGTLLFAYITGLNNLLLSSNLPFLVASIMLPFVAYYFLKSFIIEDSRIAIIGVVIVSLMDGLAVVLLPSYGGNITYSSINWYISSPTVSLYSSNICQLWLTPFKTYAAISAIAACSILNNKHAITYLIGGALFFISFGDPRYSILTILLLILLFGMRKIDVKGILLFALSTICFGGFTLSIHFYKQLLALFVALHQRGFINEGLFNQSVVSLNSLLNIDVFTIIIVIASMVLAGLIFIRFRISGKSEIAVLTSQFSQRDFSKIVLSMNNKGKKFLICNLNAFLMGTILSMFIYAVLHAYLPNSFAYITNNTFFEVLNDILLRYHILIVFFAAGLLAFKFNRRIAFVIILILFLFYFGGMVSSSISLVPLLFAVLAIPFFDLAVKRRKKLVIFSFLLFVYLGAFSATFYSATVTAPVTTEYSDLPHLLNQLLKYEPYEPVYSPSFYRYFVDRVLKMAHLELSSDPECRLYIIDKDYMENVSLDQLLRNQSFTTLYDGYKFELLARSNWTK
jgi:hypothetical protein